MNDIIYTLAHGEAHRNLIMDALQVIQGGAARYAWDFHLRGGETAPILPKIGDPAKFKTLTHILAHNRSGRNPKYTLKEVGMALEAVLPAIVEYTQGVVRERLSAQVAKALAAFGRDEPLTDGERLAVIELDIMLSIQHTTDDKDVFGSQVSDLAELIREGDGSL